MEEETQEFPRVRVTIQSLHGVAISESDHENESEPVEMTAIIGFSGSADAMQIGSSTLCSQTGKLIVESEPLEKQSDDGLYKGIWMYNHSQDPPHLTVQLPKRGEVKAQSEKKSKESSSEEDVPDLAEVSFDTKSTCSSSSRKAIEQPIDLNLRSASAVWSETDKMPEIVELSVRIKMDALQVPEAEGLAYLVLFGETETCVMDLPVRRTPASNPESRVFFTENAHLRVQISVLSPKEEKAASEKATYDLENGISESNGSDDNIVYTRSMLEQQMRPIMKKICENERLAMATHRRLNRSHDRNDRTELDKEFSQPRSTSAFCQGVWSWKQLVETLFSAVPRGCSEDADGDQYFFGQSEMASITSTIATRESLDI